MRTNAVDRFFAKFVGVTKRSTQSNGDTDDFDRTKRLEEGDLLAAKYDELMEIAKQFFKASANSGLSKKGRRVRR